MKHIKQLDSLRAISVFLVIIHHWMPWNKVTRFHPGEIGVGMFFVLSGFLITKILLENKNKAEKGHTSMAIVFRNFFFRRALRIFPIYYAAIVLLYVFHDTTSTGIENNVVYFLTYTANLYFEQRDAWDGMLSHLWSLAVEEQFYIVWPPLILLVNRKYLLSAILFFVAIGIVSQYSLGRSEFTGGLYVHNCFDAFGIGAILAWVTVYRPKSLSKMYQVLSILVVLCLVLYGNGVYQHKWIFLPLRTVIAIASLYIITFVVYKEPVKNNPISFILNNRALIFIGKISYGIYLYHLIIPHYTSGFLDNLINRHLPFFSTKYNHFILMIENFGLLILISWLSWIILEKPALRLKKYFEYKHPKFVAVKVPPISASGLAKTRSGEYETEEVTS